MTKFTLSKPQRLLFGLTIILFALATIWMLYFIASDISRTLNQAITVTYATVSPQDDNGPQPATLTYDELITQPSGSSVLAWNNHRLYLFGPAQVIINPDKVDLRGGYAYIEINGTITVTLNGQELSLSSVSGLYDTTTAGFTIFSGDQKLSGGETATINDTILYDGQKFTTASFDRHQLQSDKWKQIISLISAKSNLPLSLSDLNPPTISGIAPATNTSTAESNLTISGVTEPNAVVHINRAAVTVDANGKFTDSVALSTGNNSVLITAVDAAGNETDLNLAYVRTSATTATTNCTQSAFAAQLVCLINLYRDQTHLPALTLSDKLTNAAQVHSDWMQAQQQLNHIEDNGSTPFNRCNSAGTTCNSESIAQNAQPFAQTILDYWKSQTIDNANLLGNYAEVGAAISGEYVTADFH